MKKHHVGTGSMTMKNLSKFVNKLLQEHGPEAKLRFASNDGDIEIQVQEKENSNDETEITSS